MTDCQTALSGFLAALAQTLTAAADAERDETVAPDLGRFAALVRAVEVPARPAAGSGARLPVCRFWEAALERAETGAAAPFVPGLRAVGPLLSWTQNPNYRRRPPAAGFLESYGYAVIAGPPGGARALIADRRLAFGVLLLGPHTHYPLHGHPAVEVYCPVSGDGEWWRGTGPWRPEPPGAVIYHAPNVPHATRAVAWPLLAVYLWRGDLATHARLVRAARRRLTAGRGGR